MSEILERIEKLGADVKAANRYFDGDMIAYERYLSSFCNDGNYKKLSEALESGDAKSAEAASHTIKGMAANLALLPVMDCAIDVLADVRGGDMAEARVDFVQLTRVYDSFCKAIR